MPDSYGKRQRNTQKAKKFAAREERRAARKQQKADEAAGIFRPSPDGEDAPVDDQTGDTEPGDVVADATPIDAADAETTPGETATETVPPEAPRDSA